MRKMKSGVFGIYDSDGGDVASTILRASLPFSTEGESRGNCRERKTALEAQGHGTIRDGVCQRDLDAESLRP